MSKNILYIFIFLHLFLSPHKGMAQLFSLETKFSQQPQLMDSLNHQINFYDWQDNTASLFEDENVKSIWMGMSSLHASGGFRLPFTPDKVSGQNYFVRTTYPLSENDIFKGTFTYRRQTDSEVLWLNQSRRIEENPFLLADSSSGAFNLNGLFWSAEWSHRFSRKILFGLGFSYNVDQRLKQNFPKPLNKHRDMFIKSGLQLSHKGWKVGMTYHFISEQEKVEIRKYSLDQNLTPVLFKFRYMDLPVTLRGRTSEERKVEYSAHAFGAQILREFTPLTLLAHFRYISADSETMDGGSRAQDEGTYQKEEFISGLKILHDMNTLKFFIDYQYYSRFMNANHPDFNFTVIKHPRYEHRFITGLKAELTTQAAIFSDLYFIDFWEQKRDLATNNQWRFAFQAYSLRLGGIYHWTKSWETDLWLGYTHFNYKEKERTNNRYSPFFTYLYEEPYKFYTGKKFNTQGGIKIVYHYLPVLDVELAAHFQQSVPDSYTKNESERITMFFLLNVKIYIF